MNTRIGTLAAAACAMVIAWTGPACGQGNASLTKVHIGVGGKDALYYLPLTITEQLGYFKDAGLDVTISDFQGGSKTMQALVGGSIDVASGAYEHTITVQPKGQDIVAFVAQGRYPGYAFGIAKARAGSFQSARDLKGMKIGVTAPGSGTQNFVEYFLDKNGMSKADVSFIGVGASSVAVTAVRTGQIDAISNIDPVMTELEMSGDVKIVLDTRTTKGTLDLFGTAMPAATLYTTQAYITRNPNTVQALTSAMVRALQWIQKATPQDIARVVPARYLERNRELYLTAFEKVRDGISPDGLFPPDGVANTLKMLQTFNPEVASAKIRLDETYTNRFVEKALAELKRP